ncbi:hypothetical protein [Dactylosporangium matsuzakiense]|uniref:hypothetical protein n=1 Tax=Dactylosporangium matsuzakiense TaxID=53360 RepID=UPI0021C48110|nr:hypothetical protein [Dactylosporangium matsuzakiense]
MTGPLLRAWLRPAPTSTRRSFDPPFPCHLFLLGAGKYGLTQLRNLDRLPVTGAVIVAGPLPIVRGSGSPARVLALVEQWAPAPRRSAGGSAVEDVLRAVRRARTERRTVLVSLPLDVQSAEAPIRYREPKRRHRYTWRIRPRSTRWPSSSPPRTARSSSPAAGPPPRRRVVVAWEPHALELSTSDFRTPPPRSPAGRERTLMVVDVLSGRLVRWARYPYTSE